MAGGLKFHMKGPDGLPYYELDGRIFRFVETKPHSKLTKVAPPTNVTSLVGLRNQVTQLTDLVNSLIQILKDRGIVDPE